MRTQIQWSTGMEFFEKLKQRKSTREFQKRPVSQKIMWEILKGAHWAPSASNQQPWNFCVLTGRPLEDLKKKILQTHEKRKLSYDPSKGKTIANTYMQRTRTLFKELRPFISKLNEANRSFITKGSFCFYDAPVVVFLTIDKQLPKSRLLDIGMAAQNLMLAAHALGVGTCAIALALLYDDVIRSEISVAPDFDIALAIALGYPSAGSAINDFRSSRDNLEDFITWIGFD